MKHDIIWKVLQCSLAPKLPPIQRLQMQGGGFGLVTFKKSLQIQGLEHWEFQCLEAL